MCPGEKEQEPPLGWSLSATARTEIKRYLEPESPCGKENAAILTALTELLRPAGE
jgi:hypothetical protein